jgi:hypothetical protein
MNCHTRGERFVAKAWLTGFPAAVNNGAGLHSVRIPAAHYEEPAMTLKTLLAAGIVLLMVTSSPAAPRCGCCESPDAAAYEELGFQSIFDGLTLNGWTGATKGYVAENGVLVCLKKGGGVLRTEKIYKDFIFRFEFKNEPAGNNGIGIRIPEKGHASLDGMEIQILDDTAPVYKNLQPYQFHGSVYGVVPARRGCLKPNGQWNSEEIRIQGSKIRVTVNGMVIVDADLSTIQEPMDHRNHPGLKRTEGYLAFLGHGSRVEFRNLRVKEL